MTATIQQIQAELAALQTSLNKIISDVGNLPTPTPAPTPTPPTPAPTPTPTPPISTESASGTTIPNAAQIIDSTKAVWTVVSGVALMNGIKVGTYGSSGVTLLLYYNHVVYQENGSDDWWSWTNNDWANASDPRVSPTPKPTPTPTPTPPTPTGVFTVSQANGIQDSKGNRWELRGYNCSWTDFNNLKANLYSKFPGTNLVRLVCGEGSGTTVANVQGMITELTGRNTVVFLDYHAAVDSGTIAWYQTMCAAFKNNPLVFMEMPNEPGGNVATDQINIINALRAGGWVNPIGLQLHGGYMFDNIGPVLAAVPQNNQIFLCPHNYGDWWNGNMQNSATATGLYSVVDEFGDSTDGSTIDANGTQCVIDIIETQTTHQNGAAFWAADNGYHNGDNLFLDSQGNTLTALAATYLVPWLA